MSKHIVDKPRAKDDGARVRAYTRIERETGSPTESDRVKALHRQQRTRDDGHRAAEYARIERTSTSG